MNHIKKKAFVLIAEAYAKIQTRKKLPIEIPLKFLIKNGKKDKSDLPGSKIVIKTFQNQSQMQIKVRVEFRISSNLYSNLIY